MARGEAEIGFQQISELLPLTGIDYLGPLPAENSGITPHFEAGLHTGAKEPGAAKELISFLKGPSAAPVVTKFGMEPA